MSQRFRELSGRVINALLNGSDNIEMVMSIASSRGVSAQISSTLDAKDYICSSSTPLISSSVFDCN